MITDQCGRYFAIFIFSPYLIYKSSVYNDYILILGLLLLFYEIFWICISGPLVTYLI